MKKNLYMHTASLRALMGPMTAAERAHGRYLRAPDGHDGGDGGAGGGGSAITLSAALPDTVEDLNTIPTQLRGLYVKEGDKYVFKDPTALRSAYERTKQERNAFKGAADRASILDELGLTPDEIKELKDQKDQAAHDKAKAEGDFTALKDQMEKNHQTELDKFKGRESKLLSSLEKSMVDSAVMRALAEPGFEGNPTLLLPHLRDRVKVVETDDGFERQVLLADGKTPMLGADNKPATIKDLLTELRAKPEFQGAFKGDGQSGGGAAPTGGSGGGAGKTLKKSEMTAGQKVKYIRDHGQKEYDKLPM